MSKRPILIITIGYIIGIIWGLYLEISIVPFVIIIAITFFLMYKVIVNKFAVDNNINLKFKLIIIMLIIVTISSLIVQYKERKFKEISNNIPEDIKYIGVIVSEEKESEYYYNYIVKIKNIDLNYIINKENINNILNSQLDINDISKININYNLYTNSMHLLLKVKKDKSSKIQKLEYGDLVLVEGTFEKATTRRNYKGYDYSQYLKTKKVYGVCDTNLNGIKVLEKNSCFVINMWINQLKNKLKSNIISLLPNETASIAMALFLGDSTLIDENQKEVFSNASLSHILAISGMHVTYVIIGCSLVLKKFDKRKSKYFFMGFLIFFAQLTGESPSVVRAVIMSSMMIFSKLVYRKSDIINNLAISCFIILISNPYNILNLGFQLSFLGTLGIVLFNKKISDLLEICCFIKFDKLKIFNKYNRLNMINRLYKNDKLKKYKNSIFQKLKMLVITSISANILIFPILIYNFNIFSLTFLFSNILISPILGIIFLIGYITIIISLISIKISLPFAFFLNFLIKIFTNIATISSNITFTRFLVTTPSIITIILYYVAIIYLFYFYNKKFILSNIKKIISIITILIIIFNLKSNYNIGLKVFFIDVGQGDSTLIITQTNKKILIDGGGSETGNYDVGKKVLVPYLLDRKIKNIDYIVISHFDSDHCKGVFSVIEELNVRNVIISEQGKASENYEYFLKLASKKKFNIICVMAGNRLKIDTSTYIDVLWPDKDLIQDNVLNNNSIVCKLTYKNSSLLFVGDIEKIAEEKIVKKYSKDILNSTILKVAHHGSKSSSIEEFLEMVQPRIALIGVGEKNNFGHPSMGVLTRLNDIGAKVYRTDKMGEICVFIKGNGEISVDTFLRLHNTRFQLTLQ